MRIAMAGANLVVVAEEVVEEIDAIRGDKRLVFGRHKLHPILGWPTHAAAHQLRFEGA